MESSKSLYLILIVILGIVVFNLYNMIRIKTNIDTFDEKIENIGKQIDSIQDMNSQLDNLIQSLHTELQLIDGDIDRVQNNIFTIRRNINEKTNSVNTFTISELQEFFSKRYDSIVRKTNSETGN